MAVTKSVPNSASEPRPVVGKVSTSPWTSEDCQGGSCPSGISSGSRGQESRSNETPSLAPTRLPARAPIKKAPVKLSVVMPQKTTTPTSSPAASAPTRSPAPSSGFSLFGRAPTEPKNKAKSVEEEGRRQTRSGQGRLQ